MNRTLVCTGCGCLCDDIQVEVEDGRLGKTANACAKGTAYIQSAFNTERRPKSSIKGENCATEKAIEEAVHLLSRAEKPLIFGLDNSTLETQAMAIELARKLGATLDDSSSFSYGPLAERILTKELPTCSLSQVKDNADLLLYWGANPTATHPRHLSRYTYYAYTDFTPAGWFPNVTLSCIDIRQTELGSMCKAAFKIKPGSDRELIAGLLRESPESIAKAKLLAELIAKSKFCAMFCGMGLVHSLDGDFGSFTKMIGTLSQSLRLAVIPMISETNMLGFNQLLLKETGYVNQVSFAGGVSHGREFSFVEQVHNSASDCILIVGSDPFSMLPQSLMSNLGKTDIICLDHSSTLTTRVADVVIPTAMPGVECGGNMVRMDGDNIKLAEPVMSGYPTEGEVFKQLLEKVRP